MLGLNRKSFVVTHVGNEEVYDKNKKKFLHSEINLQ
jgi:hypothetical protein